MSDVVPDQLTIVLRTNIPGHQNVHYVPSMNVKDAEGGGVIFNPLIRLKKDVLMRIPPEYRQRQFFNHSLFQSLLNFNGEKPARNLLYATRAGLVDNNIRVTLETLFPEGSVIQIGGKPYVIGHVQWTNGDWKMDVKQPKEEHIDSKITTDPLMRNKLVNEERAKGEAQLAQLANSVKQGDHVSADETPSASAPVPPVSTPVPPVSAPVPSAPVPSAPVPSASAPSPETHSSRLSEFEPTPEIPRLTNSSVEESSHEKERMFEVLEERSKVNPQSTQKLKEFFANPSFYSLVNDIFLSFPDNIRTQITNFYRLITMYKKKEPPASKSLNFDMYVKSCNQIKAHLSPADGNCLFASVAYGLNLYNRQNPGTKFQHQQYGKTQLFTPSSLREIVLKYYENTNDDTRQTLFAIGSANVALLNDKFQRSLDEHPVKSDEDYVERMHILYLSNENFLVVLPTRRPVMLHEDRAPFTLMREVQVPTYLRSKHYWGDQFALQAFRSILKLYVVPLDYAKPGQLLARPVEPDATQNACAHNVMFVLRENLHYELVTFVYRQQSYKSEGGQMKLRQHPQEMAVFRADQYPPLLQVLVLLYGSSYVPSSPEVKQKYCLYPSIMKSIHGAVAHLVETNPSFRQTFQERFRLPKPLTDYVSLQQSGGGKEERSKIAYSVTIDLELRPGTSITPQQLTTTKCDAKLKAIQRAFANLTGQPFVVTPVYPEQTSQKTQKAGQRRLRCRSRKTPWWYVS